MKKELKKQKNENLSDWIVRLSPIIAKMTETDKIEEIIRQISVESYIEGSNANEQIMLKYRK